MDTERDALLYVPRELTPGESVPLVVMLHGAGGGAQHGISPLQRLADDKHFLLLSPPSRGRSWDTIVRQRYGPDIAFVDAALEAVFERFSIDADYIAVGGFSDGASYALSTGMMNGDLFTHVLAFSPGFMAPLQTCGTPSIFVAHGTLDTVLNIAAVQDASCLSSKRVDMMSATESFWGRTHSQKRSPGKGSSGFWEQQRNSRSTASAGLNRYVPGKTI